MRDGAGAAIDGNVQKYEDESAGGRMETKYGIGKGFRWNNEGKDAMNPLGHYCRRHRIGTVWIRCKTLDSKGQMRGLPIAACLHATDAETGSEVTFGILQRYMHVPGVVDRFSAQRIMIQLKSRLLDSSQR